MKAISRFYTGTMWIAARLPPTPLRRATIGLHWTSRGITMRVTIELADDGSLHIGEIWETADYTLARMFLLEAADGLREAADMFSQQAN